MKFNFVRKLILMTRSLEKKIYPILLVTINSETV